MDESHRIPLELAKLFNPTAYPDEWNYRRMLFGEGTKQCRWFDIPRFEMRGLNKGYHIQEETED
jgi:hypothetical protein